ncbi:acetyltransferase [Sphingobacterium thalpophilum]|uniref:acetyltransferase n=1 Tax=Sphingobacterium thalpophilum TaxID=259 RepID=UPI002D779A34|nr:acetyltransferase [Sphingobacterium thalpophilum]
MYLFGASGHGKVIAEILESKGLVVDGFIDSDPNKSRVLNYSVVDNIPSKEVELIIAIGNNQIRKKIVNENPDQLYGIATHRNANISPRTSLGDGTVIMAGATINVDVLIGKHCIINTNVSVDHDCSIESYVHLSPNVALAGNVSVGEGTHIGIGACVIQGVKIGSWCTVGAGAVIIRDIPDGCTVVGNPGRIIKNSKN